MVYAYRWVDEGDGVGHGKSKPTGLKFDVGVTPPFGEPRYFSTDDLKLVDYTTSGYVFAMEFRDSINRHWYRTRRGFLHAGYYPAGFEFARKGSLLNAAGH